MRKKQPVSEHSFSDLLQNAKLNTGIFKEFQDQAKDTHQMLAHEFAHNLNFYLDYANIFTDDQQRAHDLVQNSFTHALECPDEFAPCYSQNRDPKTILLSYIQEDLEKENNAIYLITRKILENNANEDLAVPTPTEAFRQTAIAEEIARTFSGLSEDDQNQMLNYMLSPDEGELPNEILEKFQQNENLRALYIDSNSPDISQ